MSLRQMQGSTIGFLMQTGFPQTRARRYGGRP
jgi:hypothetical protein